MVRVNNSTSQSIFLSSSPESVSETSEGGSSYKTARESLNSAASAKSILGSRASNRSSLQTENIIDVQPESIVSVSGHGVGMVGGSLYTWKAAQGKWIKSSTSHIKRIKLGANNDQMWAMDVNNRLARIQPNGKLEAMGAVTLPAGTTDFTVSFTGRKTFIADGELKCLSPVDDVEPLHPPVAMGRAKSLSQASNGKLYVLSEANTLWVKSTKLPLGSGAFNSGTADHPEYWQCLTDDTSAKQPELDRLQTLPDGGLGAMGKHGLLRFNAADGSWSPTKLNTRSAMGDFYGQFTSPMGGWDNKINIGLLTTNPNRREDQKPSTWADRLNWFTHYKPKFLADIAGADHAKLLHEEIGRNMRTLHQDNVDIMVNWNADADGRKDTIDILITGLLGDNSAAPGSVDYNASQALTTLEANAAALPRTDDYKQVFDPDRNALYAILNFRRQILERINGIDKDPVSNRLTALLNEGVYLPTDPKENKFLIPVGKMLHDHAVLMEAVSQPKHVDLAENIEAWSARIDDVASKVNVLYQSALVDANDFEKLNYASVHIGSGMVSSDKLTRALTGQDTLGEGEMAEKFVEFVGSMKKGEVISAGSGYNVNFDMERLWTFFNLTNRNDVGQGVGLTGGPWIPLNVIPIIHLLGTAVNNKQVGFDISRTANGIQLCIRHSEDAGGTIGGRLAWGAGAAATPSQTASLVSYSGVETAALAGKASSNSHSITLEFEQDDEGKVQEVLRDLFTGQASLENLLKRAASVTNSKNVTTKLTGEAYAHIYTALIGNAGITLNPSTNIVNMYRMLFLPFLGQVSATGAIGSSNTVTRSTNGTTTVAQRKIADRALTYNHITLWDVHYYSNVPLPEATFPDGSALSRNGAMEVMFKVPLYVSVMQKSLWSKQVMELGSQVHFNRDGNVGGASVSFATNGSPLRKRMGIDKPLTTGNFPQLADLLAARPELERYLNKLNEMPGMQPTVTMELTPGAMAGLRVNFREGQTKEEVVELVAAAMRTPGNLHITDISATQSNTYDTGTNKGFGPFGYGSNASNGLSRPVAQLHVTYDDAGAVTDVGVRGEALLGDAVIPDLETFNTEAANGTTSFDKWLAMSAPERTRYDAAKKFEKALELLEFQIDIQEAVAKFDYFSKVNAKIEALSNPDAGNAFSIPDDSERISKNFLNDQYKLALYERVKDDNPGTLNEKRSMLADYVQEQTQAFEEILEKFRAARQIEATSSSVPNNRDEFEAFVEQARDDVDNEMADARNWRAANKLDALIQYTKSVQDSYLEEGGALPEAQSLADERSDEDYRGILSQYEADTASLHSHSIQDGTSSLPEFDRMTDDSSSAPVSDRSSLLTTKNATPDDDPPKEPDVNKPLPANVDKPLPPIPTDAREPSVDAGVERAPSEVTDDYKNGRQGFGKKNTARMFDNLKGKAKLDKMKEYAEQSGDKIQLDVAGERLRQTVKGMSKGARRFFGLRARTQPAPAEAHTNPAPVRAHPVIPARSTSLTAGSVPVRGASPPASARISTVPETPIPPGGDHAASIASGVPIQPEPIVGMTTSPPVPPELAASPEGTLLFDGLTFDEVFEATRRKVNAQTG